MIRHPKPGQRVRLHYAAKKLAVSPYHGRTGEVVVVGNGKGPRNIAVRLDDGELVVVTRGNLVEERSHE